MGRLMLSLLAMQWSIPTVTVLIPEDVSSPMAPLSSACSPLLLLSSLLVLLALTHTIAVQYTLRSLQSMTLVLPPMATMLAFKSTTTQLRSMTALTLRPGNAQILQLFLTPAPVKLLLDTSTHTGVLKPTQSQSHTPLYQLPMPRLWPPLAFQTVPTHGATLLMALPLSLIALTPLQLLPPAVLFKLTTPRPVP